jgi:hypothetical protein
LNELSCQFAKQILAGLFSPVIEHMSSELAGQTTEEQLQQSWTGETEDLTGYVGIENVVESVGNELNFVAVTLRYADNKGAKVNFTFNENNEITKLWFETVVLPTLSESEEEEMEDENAGTASYSYEEEDFTVGRAPYELTGVLTMPEGTGKTPVVILLSGDDTLDMDGTIGLSENTPVRDIAYGLANRGIATLRYNMRAYQYNTEVSSEAGIYERFLQDACYAVNQIYNESRVDKSRIYLLGHGQAADYLAAVVQKKEKRIAGAVLMAGKPVAVQEKYYSSEEKNISFDAGYFMNDNSTMPLLILQGQADFETTTEDFEQWRTVLKGRAHTEYHSYKKLNHYFTTTSGKSDKSDYDSAGKVSTAVIDKIAEWIMQQE